MNGASVMTENQQAVELKGKLEALLFASTRPLPGRLLAKILQLETERVEWLLTEMSEDFESPGRGLQLRNISNGWRLETKPEHAQLVLGLRETGARKPLSTQALETLAIVAMKQPVTAEQINTVRGVISVGTLETLKKRKLIASDSHRGESGRRTYWKTTREFLNEFGLASLDEIYAVGRLERVFGSVFGLVGDSLNNPAQNSSQSQESRSDALKNLAPKVV